MKHFTVDTTREQYRFIGNFVIETEVFYVFKLQDENSLKVNKKYIISIEEREHENVKHQK